MAPAQIFAIPLPNSVKAAANLSQSPVRVKYLHKEMILPVSGRLLHLQRIIALIDGIVQKDILPVH